MNVLKSTLVLALGFSVSSTVFANELIKVAQDNVKSTVTEKVTSTKEVIADKAKNAKDMVSEKAVSAKEAVADKAKTVKEAVSEKATSAKEVIADKAKAAKETVADKAKSAKETVVEKVSSSAKVNVNTADVATLQQLSGIGDVKAKAIVDYRNKIGKFKSAQDLINVPGIGEATIEKIKPFLSF